MKSIQEKIIDELCSVLEKGEVFSKTEIEQIKKLGQENKLSNQSEVEKLIKSKTTVDENTQN